MSLQQLYPDPLSYYQIAKTFCIAVLAALLSLSCSGCGVKLGDNFVIGTRSFLAEVNAGQFAPDMDRHNSSDKQKLSALIQQRRY